MLTGTIQIHTCYGRTEVGVRILGLGPYPDTLQVQALGGLQPFTKVSPGGPYQDDSALVRTLQVHNIRIAPDPAQDGPQDAAPPEFPERAPDEHLEASYEDRTCLED